MLLKAQPTLPCRVCESRSNKSTHSRSLELQASWSPSRMKSLKAIWRNKTGSAESNRKEHRKCNGDWIVDILRLSAVDQPNLKPPDA